MLAKNDALKQVLAASCAMVLVGQSASAQTVWSETPYNAGSGISIESRTIANTAPYSSSQAISDLASTYLSQSNAASTYETIAAHNASVIAIGYPTSRTVAFATAYQATTASKPAFIGVEIECPVTVALLSAASNTVELVIGSTNAVASGTGTRVDTTRTDLSVSIALSLGFTNRQFLQAFLPANGYFAARRTVGTACTVISAFDQQIG